MTTISTTHYASIGKRFVAIFIDGLLLQVIFFIAYGKPPTTEEMFTPKGIGANLLGALMSWVYFAVMESSPLQGTFGKRLLSIIVTDTDGKKISFGRATLRYLAKSLWLVVFIFGLVIALMVQNLGQGNSPYLAFAGLLLLISIVLFFIGYLMAFFTPEKQALHDMIARCLVVNGSGQTVKIPWRVAIGLAIGTIVLGRVVAQLPGTSSNTTVLPPQPTPTNTSIPIPPTHNNPPISSDDSGTIDRIFGELVPARTNVYGVWELNFANGVVPHRALLSMRGTSGVMEVQYSDENGVTQTVRQSMRLWSSARGLVLIGRNPIDIKTNRLSPTYAPDNFLIATRPDNSVLFRNYSFSGADKSLSESPVERKFLGFPTVGIKMVELTPQNREQINQKGRLPFQVTRDTGIFIVDLETNSTAGRSGIRPGDIVLSINNTTVNNVKQAQELIWSSSLDSTLRFDIDRGGENLSLPIPVGCCINPQQESRRN